MDNKKIGIFILNLRKEKNMTQKDLADKLYISDKAVSKWERGLAMPDIGSLEKLASILGVNVGEILKGEKIKNLTKKETDEIIKESMNIFQKRYLKNKISRISIAIILLLFSGYFIVLSIGEVNYGSISWNMFGNSYMMYIPSFSSEMSKKKSIKYIEALKDSNYDTVRYLLRTTDSKYLVDLVTLTEDEYIDNLKELKKEGFKIVDYRYEFGYYNNYMYVSSFEIVIEVNKTKYVLNMQFQSYGKYLLVQGMGYSSEDSFKINNPIINLESKDKEMYTKIENVFTHY